MITTESYNKKIWYAGEQAVQSRYESQRYTCKEKNFTIRWWEIDLILENAEYIVFVECKVVNYAHDLHDYITAKKLQALKRSIETYLRRYPTEKVVRVDVVFLKNNSIIEHIQDVEL